MTGSVWIVQVGCVGMREGDREDAGPNGDYPETYERVGGSLARLYGALLGMRRFDPGHIKLRDDSGATPDFGFEGKSGSGDEPARWPNPEYPQQVHLDIDVGDLTAGEQVVLEHGARRAADFGDHRVYIDQASHPFCLYLDESLTSRPTGPLTGRLARVVFDCFSPRALASFYEVLLGMTDRVFDTSERVVIAKPEGSQRYPMLAFNTPSSRPPVGPTRGIPRSSTWTCGSTTRRPLGTWPSASLRSGYRVTARDASPTPIRPRTPSTCAPKATDPEIVSR